jgi:hypothetical protein
MRIERKGWQEYAKELSRTGKLLRKNAERCENVSTVGLTTEQLKREMGLRLSMRSLLLIVTKISMI